MDSFGVVDGVAPFESGRLEFRNAFRPFTFQPLEVWIDDERLIYGMLGDVGSRKRADRSTVSIQGYSKPGVMALNACPESLLPLEFRGYGLRQIASALAEPFGVLPIFREDEGAKFAKAKAEVDQRPYDFLAALARQRNLIIGSDADGNMLFWRSVEPGAPVARLVDGLPPVVGVDARLSSRQYHSHITAFTKRKRRRKGARYTVSNPFLRDRLRPMSFTLDDTDAADAPAAARAKLGRMFAAAATYEVEVATWRDPSGRLWSPNTTLTALAPDYMVYRETELVVRAVTFMRDANSKSAKLQLVLPGAFTGEVPEVLPWAE